MLTRAKLIEVKKKRERERKGRAQWPRVRKNRSKFQKGMAGTCMSESAHEDPLH